MAAILEKVKARLSNYESTILEQLGEGNWLQKLVYENKETSARIHYHSIENVRIVRQILLEQLGQVAQEAGLRVVENRKAVEVRPPLEVNKGSALLRLKEAYQLNGLIFLGDDLTDLEGFRTLRLLEEQSRRESTPAFSTPFYSLAVGVSTPEMPPALALAAHLLVDGVNGVEKFLASLFAAIP
jgi:trehalose 6-phosphate phosphatase